MSRRADDDRDALAAELDRLRAENAALRAQLAARTADVAPASSAKPRAASADVALPPRTTRAKLDLFRRRFAGRTDVYPVRWQNAAGRSGYSPACQHEWQPGVCGKPAVKCGACPNPAFRSVTDEVLLEHLRGRLTLGVYPLLGDDTCRFLAVDFDEDDWRSDALAFARTARAAGVPVALEISRSGRGAHAWTFFAAPVPAVEARQLGSALLTATCREHRQLALRSYDRLFPSQDTLPSGGFGNLIALPFQHEPRSRGCSVFVDDDWRPYDDQWGALAAFATLSSADVRDRLLALRAAGPEIDAILPVEEETETPWRRPAARSRVAGAAPTALKLTLAQQLYVDKAGLSPSWIHAVARLACFQNPAFYQAQAVRRSVWNIPRLIGCARNLPAHVALPRGAADALLALAREHGVPVELDDQRSRGEPLRARFTAELTADQQSAVQSLAEHECGVLWAPTGFGKTVVAAALIAHRAVSTLVLVHRAELLKQWRTRLASFLDLPLDAIGALGDGRATLGGTLDVALLQSLTRRQETLDVTRYGHVVVDECHHVPAVSFERTLAELPARYVTGLTATPIRRDGQHPIMQLQFGPIRWSARRLTGGVEPAAVRFERLAVLAPADPAEPIQSVLARLARSSARNAAVARAIVSLVATRRRVLVLTERAEHLQSLAVALGDPGCPVILLNGRLGKRARARAFEALAAVPPTSAFVVIATGRLTGEGFDDPRLDALVAAMPFSWKGTVQQYVGRLMRPAPHKPRPLVVDFEDMGVRVLERMAGKRRAGYRLLGSTVVDAAGSGAQLLLE